MLLVLPMIAQASPVQFTLDGRDIESNSGHVRLVWKSEGDTLFVLQQAPDSSFLHAKTIYEGPDLASFVSGLRNGNYYFRVRGEDDQWSDVVHLHVQHQSLELAFTLFGIGGIVFLLTVFVVLKGAGYVQINER